MTGLPPTGNILRRVEEFRAQAKPVVVEEDLIFPSFTIQPGPHANPLAARRGLYTDFSDIEPLMRQTASVGAALCVMEGFKQLCLSHHVFNRAANTCSCPGFWSWSV